jgi:hypothetical protein
MLACVADDCHPVLESNTQASIAESFHLYKNGRARNNRAQISLPAFEEKQYRERPAESGHATEIENPSHAPIDAPQFQVSYEHL